MKFERKVIDAHWHLFDWYDENGRDFYTVLDGYQTRHGMAGVNICATPCFHDAGPAQNVLAALYKLHNPNAYAYGGMVYTAKPFLFPQPEGFDFRAQYDELMEIGFDGIKLLETKPEEQKEYGFQISDAKFEPLFDACEKNGTHLVWHVADPETFWDIDRIPKRFVEQGWFYGDGTYIYPDQLYGQVENVLSRHPKLKVTFAHFFFRSEHPELLEDLFAKYENVGVDITPGAEMYADFREKRTYYRDFFTKYADRILFGTDTEFERGAAADYEAYFDSLQDAVYTFAATDRDTFVIVEDVKGLDLPETAKDKILYQNFMRMAGERPKSVDVEALKRYVEKYKPYFADKELLARIEQELQEKY